MKKALTGLVFYVLGTCATLYLISLVAIVINLDVVILLIFFVGLALTGVGVGYFAEEQNNQAILLITLVSLVILLLFALFLITLPTESQMPIQIIFLSVALIFSAIEATVSISSYFGVRLREKKRVKG